MFIPYGEWMPDSPALVGAARVAKNCIGEKDYYRPFLSFSAQTGALGSRAFGAISFADRAGTTFTFAGDATKLYKLASSAFSNVSKSGDYNTLTDGRWEFAKYGNYVIATNYLNNVQYFNLSSSTLFDDLPGTPPRAKHVFVINNFVVLANLTSDPDYDTASNALRWCAIDNPLSWTQSATTQSDKQILEQGDGGAIQGVVVNSNSAIIFQERCIQRMTYVGSPNIFTFDILEEKRGTPLPNSVIGIGRLAFYISDDGFYMFNGVQSIPIGKDKCSKYFYDNIDLNYKDRISASIDPLNTIVMWAFCVSGSGGTPNRIITYNWISGRFTLIEATIEILYSALTEGLTLEDLDDISTNIDAGVLLSFDSLSYQGGKLLSGAFNSDHKAGYFNGDAMTAVIETTEFEGAKARFSEINQAMPMIEGDSDTTITARWGSRISQQEDVSYSTSLSKTTQGYIQPRANSRFHRIETTIAGGFEKATGIEIDEEQIRIGAKR